MIRMCLPAHLRNLSRTGEEVSIELTGEITLCSVLDALEESYPMLKGTIREHATKKRRAYVRFFACERDFSHEPPETPLPAAVASGKEPLYIIGAIAGG